MKDDTPNLPPKLQAYLERIGAEVRNFRRFVVKREGRDHYHYDAVVIRIVGGKIVCADHDFAPTKEERTAIEQEIEQEIEKGKWPKSIAAHDTELLRDLLREKGEHDPLLFEFRKPGPDGGIPFVQQRIETDNGKADLPWSLWSDGQWRCMEPDGDLPLWGLEKLHTAATVFLHEGAKGAAVLSDPAFLQGHPWADELADRGAAHVGWPGGAPNAHRVDWEPIRKLPPQVRVIIVCDNDISGTNAAANISRIIQRRCSALIFGNCFPPHFDLADPFPARFWKMEDRCRVYEGPSYSDCLVSATWATRPSSGGKGKFRLREEFESEWFWVVKPTVFVHRDHIGNLLTEKEFNAACRPFSDVRDVAELLQQSLHSRANAVVYEPALPPGRISMPDCGVVLNNYRPSLIKPSNYEEGEDQPWLGFMEHLIPDKVDRDNLLKWVATLIARPDIKMRFGVLLISEVQGIGKGTLGEKILAPIIGHHNTSTPNEAAIDSDYNYWAAHKRLAIVHEIYAGQSKKAYNKLKSTITDDVIELSQKYMASYSIRNWLHLFACSNSMRALRLDDTDRRWFIPRVTEERKERSFWTGLNRWLSGEGLRIIAQWAHDYVVEHGPVETGEHPPETVRKKEVIKTGMSDGEAFVAELGESLRLHKDKALVRLDVVRVWLGNRKAAFNPREYAGDVKLETPETIAAVLRGCGLKRPDKQFKCNGRRFRVFANFDIEPDAKWEDIEAFCFSPEEVYEWPGEEGTRLFG